MKTLITTLILLSLTGCSTYAKYADMGDPCQSKNWREKGGHMDMTQYKRDSLGYPTFCRTTPPTIKSTIRDNTGRVIGTIETR